LNFKVISWPDTFMCHENTKY